MHRFITVNNVREYSALCVVWNEMRGSFAAILYMCKHEELRPNIIVTIALPLVFI